MLVLGIESSCDESAVALLELDAGKPVSILFELISSQIKLHEEYGGVVPELAAREHLKNLPLILDQLQMKTGIKRPDLIATTRGPGLKGCLLIGLEFAKGIALAWNTPIVGVNHIEGHVLSPFLTNPTLTFPYLALVVSGGHTEIVIVRGYGQYEIFSRTTDDAAGEAFDKSANLLGLGYPGGAALAKLADTVKSSPYKLPKVMRDSQQFSFSGLKTAIWQQIQKNPETKSGQAQAEMAYAIQEAIIYTLIDKLKSAINATGIRTVTVSGGVSANTTLRSRVSSLASSYFPTITHATDNAAMIAYTGWQRFIKGESLSLDSGALARWPVETL